MMAKSKGITLVSLLSTRVPRKNTFRDLGSSLSPPGPKMWK